VSSDLEFERAVNEAMEPYAKELGLLLQAWNHLHYVLTLLFLAICTNYQGEKIPEDILLGIWNAVPNDRQQRNMLRAAAKARFGRHEKVMKEIGIDVELIRQNESIRLNEILWVLDRADYLGRMRDDSAHVPTGLNVSNKILQVVPMESLQHPIGDRLSGQNLVELFSLHRARMETVSKYAQALWAYFVGGNSQPHFPQRPAWPSSSI
jgi:hypothetical protein